MPDFDYDMIINCECNVYNEMITTDYFNSSVCFSRKGYNLSHGRFCVRYKQVFLRYFIRKLHLIEKNSFLVRK